MGVFEELNKLNVNEFTENKEVGKKMLTYLSWTWAFGTVKKRYPDMKYEIRHWDGKPYLYDENLGYMVETSVTIEGETQTMWLAVMDSHNAAMKNEPYDVETKYSSYTVNAASMTDINKTIMRCLVKNFAMFGLGLYIYAGEDLPEDEKREQENQKVSPEIAATIKKVYKGEDLKRLLTENHVENVEDLSMKMGVKVMNYLKNHELAEGK